MKGTITAAAVTSAASLQALVPEVRQVRQRTGMSTAVTRRDNSGESTADMIPAAISSRQRAERRRAVSIRHYLLRLLAAYRLHASRVVLHDHPPEKTTPLDCSSP